MVEERRVAYSAYEHKNYKLAFILLNKLAKQGDVYANFNLAHLLESGQGTPVDIKRAIQHYKFAVENGVLAAANNLGVIYSDGVGDESGELAIYYYKLAADQGNARAQSNLAQLYLMGDGVEYDVAIAHEYFSKAALQNDALSQYQLGVMYFKGDGVEKDFINAYAWILLAKQNGDTQAQYILDELKPLLDSAELFRAKERSINIRQLIAEKLSTKH
ncbi:MAG: sel1 repeat family protein [Gammaproteobacteria bacterium]|nr:sel1 repeat family protein [Gammaproteobacteria bacterium]